MVSALRAGEVTMVNCLGSGVLESRALLAFLPRIAKRLLGEGLKLPNIATWWCGQAMERDYVVQNLSRMMIGPALETRLPFDFDASTVLGSTVRGRARASIAEWLAAEGDRLVGQQSVSLSTTPAMVDGQLVPRPVVVRVFAARTKAGWLVMPGGYARIGVTDDTSALSLQKGGRVADVWVVSDAAVRHDSLTATTDGGPLRRIPGLLPSRAAENLYWLGRYVERAETSVRLLRAYHHRLEDAGDADLPLVAQVGGHLSGRGLIPDKPVPEGLLQVFDHCRAAAGTVRDRFSIDGWNALVDLAETARSFAGRVAPGDDTARAMSVLLRKLAGFSGLVHDNMFHFTGWRFLTMGRALERASQTASFIRAFAGPKAPSGGFDLAIELGDSVFAHRRLYSVETNRATVVDLLILDRDNPRSILYQVDVLKDQVDRLASPDQGTQLSPLARVILRLQTDLAITDAEAVTDARLAALGTEVAAISDADHRPVPELTRCRPRPPTTSACASAISTTARPRPAGRSSGCCRGPCPSRCWSAAGSARCPSPTSGPTSPTSSATR